MIPWVSISRDLSIVAVTCGVWWADAARVAPDGAAKVVFAALAGVLAAVVGFVAHEWGHLAGSLVTKSRVHFPNRVLAPLLFHFEVAHNDRRQFLWMSYGGYAGSAVAVAAIGALATLGTLSGRVALVLAGVGTLVTLVTELPTTFRVARGAPLPDGYAFKPPLRAGA